MTRMQRAGVLGLCIALAGASLLPSLLKGQQAPPTAEAARAAAAPAYEPILDKLRDTQEKMGEIMPSLKSIADPAFRTGDGQKVLPLLKQSIGLWKELQTAIPTEDARETVRENKFRFLAMAAALDDKDSAKELEAAAAGKVEADAVSAKAGLLMADWMRTSKDPAAQAKLLGDFTPFAKAHATNDEIAVTLAFLANVGAADDESSKKIGDLLRNDLKGDAAKALAEQFDLAQVKKDMVGRPLVLSGETPGGGTFSTESLKGRVVLVDFWATWCGPCVASLPELKQIYTAHHGEGFEILGVSSDESVDALTGFIKENAMPWPELWDKSQDKANPPLHPINKKYGFNAIPATMIIDKQGVVRYLRYFESTPEGSVRRDLGDRATLPLEEQVKALLAEKPGDAPAQAPAAKP